MITLEPLSISYPDLMEFPHFAHLTERGVWGERMPKDKVETG